MIPQTRIAGQEPDATDPAEAVPQEPFVRQVEDHSLPAQDVLTDQHEAREPDEAPALFIP